MLQPNVCFQQLTHPSQVLSGSWSSSSCILWPDTSKTPMGSTWPTTQHVLGFPAALLKPGLSGLVSRSIANALQMIQHLISLKVRIIAKPTLCRATLSINSKKEWWKQHSTSHLGLLFFYLCLPLPEFREETWQHGDFWVLQCAKSETPQKKREYVGRSTWNEGKISWVSWKLPKSLLQILWIHWMGKTLQMHQSNSVKGAGSTFESGTKTISVPPKIAPMKLSMKRKID